MAKNNPNSVRAARLMANYLRTKAQIHRAKAGAVIPPEQLAGLDALYEKAMDDLGYTRLGERKEGKQLSVSDLTMGQAE